MENRRKIKNYEFDLDFGDMWNTLKKNRNFIAKATGTCFLLGAIATFGINPGYEAIATLKVQPPRSLNKSMLDTEMINGNLAYQYLTTYSQLLTSRGVVYDAIKSLNDPKDKDKDINDIYEEYVKSIVINPVKDATVMEVVIKDKDQKHLEAFSKLLFSSFFNKVTTIDQGNSRDSKGFVNEQLNNAKKDMEAAESNLRKFQTDHKVLSPEEDIKVASQKINIANSIKAESEVAMKAAETRLAEISAKLAENGAIMADNDLIKEYQKKLAELSIRKVALDEKFTEKHPAVIQVNEDIAGVREQLAQEIANVAKMQSTSNNKAYQDLLTEKINSEVTVAVNRSKLEAVKGLEDEYARNVVKLSENRQKYAQLTREVNVSQEIYSMLRKRLEEGKVAAGVENGAIKLIDAPVIVKAKRHGGLKIGLSLLLGLLGSSGFVLARDILRPRIKKESDVVNNLGVDVLATIPQAEELRVDAYRLLRANILALKEVKTILFTSFLDGQNAGAVVESLAKLMAEAGYKTLIMNSAGLIGLLNGIKPKTMTSNLEVCQCENMPVGGKELLASKALQELLLSLKEEYDFILIDAPVLELANDSIIIGNKVDGFIPIVEIDKAEIASCENKIQALDKVGARILGFVLSQRIN